MDYNKPTFTELGLRLREIGKMKPDGLFLDKDPPNDEQLKWFMALIAQLELPAPWVYINPTGELFVQWDFKKYDVDSYFDFEKKDIKIDVYDKSEDTFIVEVLFQFEEFNLAKRMADFLERFKE